MKNLSYPDALSFLYGLQRFGMKLGLERIRATLARLGNPQEAFTSIHVAGTNGKGSTCFFLERMLREAGISVGLYTSPHLRRFEERILVGGNEIEKDYIAGWVSREREYITEESLTFFEAVTAMAFCYFRARGVELGVCEVGLGGRLDATNVLLPRCAVITTIGIDHEEQLGPSKRSIALEKLGIVKEGVPVVTGEEDREIIALHRDIAREREAGLYVLGEEVHLRYGACSSRGSSFDYRSAGMSLDGLRVRLAGSHQVQNAALAILSVEVALGAGAVSEEAVRRGLLEARAPGRFEILATPRGAVVLDVAHNPAAMQVLVKTSEEVFPGVKPVIVLGMSSDKNGEGVVRILSPLAGEFIVTKPDYRRHDRKARAAHLFPVARGIHGSVCEEPDVGRAVSIGLERTGGGRFLLVTGSFYTVAEAIAYLEAEGLLPEKI
jgi:dihydrofolate synthase/folylpolyglutamate synthase